MNKPIDNIPESVMEVLRTHDWPGNIRELQNFIERAVVMTQGNVLCLPLLESMRIAPAATGEPKGDAGGYGAFPYCRDAA
ncbi:MAG: hypothetical protein WDO73_16915 [Ignavibacteriota bacterium]